MVCDKFVLVYNKKIHHIISAWILKKNAQNKTEWQKFKSSGPWTQHSAVNSVVNLFSHMCVFIKDSAHLHDSHRLAQCRCFLVFNTPLIIAQLECNISAEEHLTTIERSHADWLPRALDDSSNQPSSQQSLLVHLVTHADVCTWLQLKGRLRTM